MVAASSTVRVSRAPDREGSLIRFILFAFSLDFRVLASPALLGIWNHAFTSSGSDDSVVITAGLQQRFFK
jgi:hypothetical protein